MQYEASHGIKQAAAGYQRNNVNDQKHGSRCLAPSGKELCTGGTENSSKHVGQERVLGVMIYEQIYRCAQTGAYNNIRNLSSFEVKNQRKSDRADNSGNYLNKISSHDNLLKRL